MITIYEFDTELYEIELNDFLENKKIKSLISSSKQLLSDLSKDNIKKFVADNQTLFDDPNIKGYINAAGKVGTRHGWFKGGIIGIILGSLAGGGLALSNGLPVAIIALIGALVGGASVGFSLSKLLKIWYKWKAEEEVTATSGKGVLLNVHAGNR